MFARLIAALLLTACGLYAQAFRVDPFIFTVSGTAPIGSSTQVLTLPGISVQVCTDSACANLATTYTSATAGTPCPANAQVTLPDSNVCQATSGDQGQFGFWVTPGTYYYSAILPTGDMLGPYPVSAGTPSSSVSSVTAGAGISVSPTSGPVVVTNTGAVSFNGRTGAVVAVSGDYTYSQIGGPVQGSTTKPQMAGVNSNTPGASLCDDGSGNATTSGCLQVNSFNGRTGAVVPTGADYTYSLIGGTKQGNTNKPQMAGVNSGVVAALLCNDASGNATTAGCSGAGTTVTSFKGRTDAVVPISGDYTYSLITGPVQGNTTKPQMAGANSGTPGATLCDDANGNATTVGCTGGGGGISAINGTSNQITAVTVAGVTTISLPVSVATTEYSCTAVGSAICYASPYLFVDGAGNLTTSAAAGGGNAIFAGGVDTAVWFGMLPISSCASLPVPGSGYAALSYKTGGSGDVICLYDTTHSSWNTIDLAAVAGGITSINGQTGSAQTIAVGASLSLVTTTNTQALNAIQDIRTTATPTFAGVLANGAFNSTATGSSTAFVGGGGTFIVTGAGDINSATFANTNGYKIGSVYVIDASKNAVVNNLTIGGICTGCVSSGVSSITGTANQVTASAPTGAVTLSLPQSIATTSSVTFANVVANGAFNSAVTGATQAFIANGGAVSITGAGNAGFAGVVNSNGYQIGGITLVDNSRQATFTNVFNSGAFNSSVTGATTAYTANGGTFIVTGAGDINSATFANTNGYKIGSVYVIDASKNGTLASLILTGLTGGGNQAICVDNTGHLYAHAPGSC